MTPFARNHRRRVLQHERIAVETNQGSSRLNTFEDFSAVPTAADCAINNRQTQTQVEGLQCFPQQNGDVYRSQRMLLLIEVCVTGEFRRGKGGVELGFS